MTVLCCGLAAAQSGCPRDFGQGVGQINFADQRYVCFVKPVREKYSSSVFRKIVVLSSRPASTRGANASSRS
jgi:hypothetical protein